MSGIWRLTAANAASTPSREVSPASRGQAPYTGSGGAARATSSATATRAPRGGGREGDDGRAGRRRGRASPTARPGAPTRRSSRAARAARAHSAAHRPGRRPRTRWRRHRPGPRGAQRRAVPARVRHDMAPDAPRRPGDAARRPRRAGLRPGRRGHRRPARLPGAHRGASSPRRPPARRRSGCRKARAAPAPPLGATAQAATAANDGRPGSGPRPNWSRPAPGTGRAVDGDRTFLPREPGEPVAQRGGPPPPTGRAGGRRPALPGH